MANIQETINVICNHCGAIINNVNYKKLISKKARCNFCKHILKYKDRQVSGTAA